MTYRNQSRISLKSLNRTIVELKLIFRHIPYVGEAELESNHRGIETRSRYSNRHRRGGRLNRTIVELKLSSRLYHYRICLSLNRTIVELKPDLQDADVCCDLSLNRTIVELKHRPVGVAGVGVVVLESNHRGIETVYSSLAA